MGTGDCRGCGHQEAAWPATANRPGLPAIADRAGTHGSFLAAMLARLSEIEVEGADGETLHPLQALGTRDPSDLSIGLLDGFACVADVLTFYGERLTNEGYLRTATERRSVVELARLIGYRPRPGVAATAHLAYQIDAAQAGETLIPAGSAVGSTPRPGEQPQTFETVEPLVARAAWNDLAVRTTRPQQVAWDEALTVERLHLQGTPVLRSGDLVLLGFGRGRFAVRTVAGSEPEPALAQTVAILQPLSPALLRQVEKLAELAEALKHVMDSEPQAATLLAWAQARLDEAYLGRDIGLLRPGGFDTMPLQGKEEATQAMAELMGTFKASLVPEPKDAPTTEPLTDAAIVRHLLAPRKPQQLNAQRLPRRLAETFADGGDASTRLLGAFAPELRDTFLPALAGANLNKAKSTLVELAVFRLTAAPFGATAPFIATQDADRRPLPPDQWRDWPLAADERADTLFLDQAQDGLLPGSWLLVDRPNDAGDARRLLCRAAAVRPGPRAAYGIAGRITEIVTGPDWWHPAHKGGNAQDMAAATADGMATLRRTQAWLRPETLVIGNEPILEPVAGREIELADLHGDLAAGRWIVVAGERDIPGLSGVRAAELAMVAELGHGFDPALAGDRTHSTLHLATELAYRYRRATVSIFGNVTRATHGETRRQPMGSGEGASPFQQFELRLTPLTYVSAPTPSGIASTLDVRVNDIRWTEVDSLAASGPGARVLTVRIDDDGATRLLFGDGRTGARLPSGLRNVEAVYRQGIGRGGNVAAGQLDQPLSRPLGVRQVSNPLRASGGADREDRDTVRANAPLAVTAFDRLVSVADHADFARTFAGIGKSQAIRLSDGRRQVVHVTVAGVDDMPIDPASDLHRNLAAAFRAFGDANGVTRIQAREAVLLVLSARIAIEPDRSWEVVERRLRATVLDRLGFARARLGEAALLGPVLAAMQAVPGVAYVDVDAFGGVPERRAGVDGTRLLLTPAEIAASVRAIARSGSAPGQAQPSGGGVPQVVRAQRAGMEAGKLRPAQLPMMSPDLPETLVLNQLV